ITLEDLEEAIERSATVQICFENDNPLKPIVKDIFYSVRSRNNSKKNSTLNKVLRVEAEEIILVGNKRVVIQSGNVKTTYEADGGGLITEAGQIESSASKNQRIKGKSLFLN
ncbi:MAG: hypothetical protein MJE63_17445, partial [Proteobacteria bacterium]|nr:hypothetical protein [Pseudomonadota bacterium]